MENVGIVFMYIVFICFGILVMFDWMNIGVF